jgi:tetratricopeptide (TPR) repeat protein
LLYAYLQQGRYNQAEQLLKLMKKVMSESTYNNKLRPDYYENNYAGMAAAFVVETERWELANQLFPPDKTANTSEQTTTSGSHPGHTQSATENTVRYPRASRNLPPFIRALSATVRDAEVNYEPTGIRGFEVAALSASLKGDHAKAIELMQKATALEEQMSPPSGPPILIKPSHELFGEILLRAGKPSEAGEKFKKALVRQPNRARSLLGAARAAAKSGDSAAATAAYTKFVEQWNQADEGLPELREARDYLKQVKGTKSTN